MYDSQEISAFDKEELRAGRTVDGSGSCHTGSAVSFISEEEKLKESPRSSLCV